jgi:hypothetical protein
MLVIQFRTPRTETSRRREQNLRTVVGGKGSREGLNADTTGANP